MHTFVRLAFATVIGSALSIAAAQSAGSDSKMKGDMGDHPHMQTTPGNTGPMGKDKDDPKMRGDMGDHPHQQAAPAGKRAMSKEREDPKMRGAMPDHPHLPSTSAPTK